jgi:hypothetical protein
MQAHWANDSAYYRCRFPAEYALANKIDHPRNVFVREREVLPELDAWLATEFAPHRIEATIEQMAAAQDSPGSEQQVIAEAHRSIRESDRDGFEAVKAASVLQPAILLTGARCHCGAIRAAPKTYPPGRRLGDRVRFAVSTGSPDSPLAGQQRLVPSPARLCSATPSGRLGRCCPPRSKMARYRAAIDAGGDVEEIGQWINAAKAERLLAVAALCATPPSACMTREEISAIVERFTSIAAVIRDADPADKAEIYREINLMLTYEPEEQIVRAQAHLSANSHGVMVGWLVGVRGGT